MFYFLYINFARTGKALQHVRRVLCHTEACCVFTGYLETSGNRNKFTIIRVMTAYSRQRDGSSSALEEPAVGVYRRDDVPHA